MEVNSIRGFILLALTAAVPGELTFVSELSSKPAQKLSRYGWYGNVRLQHFHMPPDVAVARWLLSVTKSSGFHCGQHNVTVYMRWGSPPVIDPLGSVFPNDTLWSPALSVSLLVTSQTSVTFNLSSPAAGDWYLAAHLPRDDGRIEQKGFPSCTYVFQPQLSIRRAVDTPILEQATPLTLTAAPDRPARLKVFVPEFVSSLSLSVTDCSLGEEPENRTACSLVVRLGSASLRARSVALLNCSSNSCSATLPAPPWNSWVRVVVENHHDNQTATFSIMANNTVGCIPSSEGLRDDDDITRLRVAMLKTGNEPVVTGVHGNEPPVETVVHGNGSEETRRIHGDEECVRRVPVLQEDLDVLSLRFSPVAGGNVNVTHTRPTLLSYPLHTHSVTGGTLNLLLTLNTTNITVANSSVVLACFTPWSPVLNISPSQPCSTAFFTGYAVSVNSSVSKATVRIPFPQPATWYLTLLLTCTSGDCASVPVVAVVPEVHVSACVEDCGTYGECRLLRSYSYLYAACVCKAGMTNQPWLL